MKRLDRRSAEAEQYRALYFTPEWRKRRIDQLRRHTYCKLCAVIGKHTRATTADHVKPHKGDRYAFFRGELQSLCDTCHSSAKQRIERLGFDVAVDASGWPIDSRHPANRRP